MDDSALIVTLQMDARSAARFTALRRAHFPAERNWLDAHITLFHALPGAYADDILGDIAQAADRQEAFALQVERVYFLGAGVAYAMSSPEGMALREDLARCWPSLLGRQDRHWRGPLHVTVQNKVRPEEARRLHAALERDFVPGAIDAVGLQVWEYLGGPWRPVATYPFRERSMPGDRLPPCLSPGDMPAS